MSEAYACQRCGKTAFPGFVLGNAGKLIVECSNQECLFQDASMGPADFNRGVAAMPTEGAGGPGWGGKQQVEVDTTRPIAPDWLRPFGSTRPASLPAGPSPMAISVMRAPAPGDVITWIQERTIWLGAEQARLDGEIVMRKAQLAGVKSEQRRLLKMLRAGQREDARECAAADAPSLDN